MGMFHFNKDDCVYAFTSGKVLPLSEVHDEVFSKGLVGNGIAVRPKDGKFYSPVDGQVTMVFPTLHAVGIKSKGGFELILHVGLDTVKLNGKGFQAFVKDGDSVKKGELLLTADLAVLEQEGYDTVSLLVVTEPLNTDLKYSKLTECAENKDVLFQVK